MAKFLSILTRKTPAQPAVSAPTEGVAVRFVEPNKHGSALTKQMAELEQVLGGRRAFTLAELNEVFPSERPVPVSTRSAWF